MQSDHDYTIVFFFPERDDKAAANSDTFCKYGREAVCKRAFYRKWEYDICIVRHITSSVGGLTLLELLPSLPLRLLACFPLMLVQERMH